MFGIDQATVARVVMQIGQMSEMHKDFEPPIYNIWNLNKQDNVIYREVRITPVFGAFFCV